MPLDSTAKDPVRVRAGHIGATRRWGAEPRVVRIADLTSEQRRLVLALIDAARLETHKAAADLDPATAESEGHGNDRPTT